MRQKNRIFLEKYSPLLVRIMDSEKPSYPEVQLECMNTDCYQLTSSEYRCNIFSIFNKEEYIKSLVAKIENDTEVIVLFGFEFGELIRRMFNDRPAIKYVIAIEPSINVFSEVTGIIDFSEVFIKDRSVSLVLNRKPSEAGWLAGLLLRDHQDKKFQIISNTAYRAVFDGYFEEFTLSLRDTILSQSVNALTEHGTLHLYTNNVMRNHNLQAYMAQALFDELKLLSCPAIIVSAGPSLSKNIHLLESLKEKAFIVSVGTATRILDEKGIVPHLRVAIDGFPSESIFSGLNTEAAPLLFCEKIHWGILPDYKGLRFKMILDADYITQYLFSESGYEQIEAKSGYSVANTTLDLLARIGFKKIVMIGQDLCYTDKKLYADGAVENEDVEFNSMNYFRTKDIFGNSVYTSMPFASMKNLFERIIARFENTTFINASEGGLHIEGTTDMPLREAMEGLPDDPGLKGLHERAVENAKKMPDFRLLNTANIHKMFDELKAVVSIDEEIIRFIKDRKKEYESSIITKKQWVRFSDNVRVFRNRLNRIELFKKVILEGLEKTLLVLNQKSKYEGTDYTKLYHAEYDRLLAEITAIHYYCLFMTESSKKLKESNDELL